MRLRVGTRGSALALEQTRIATEALKLAASSKSIACEVEAVHISTKGDERKDAPFAALGAKGVFTDELQRALHAGDIDLAVHSAKDLAAAEPDGLVLAVFCERSDARDVLVSRDGQGLDSLPAGAVVGTSSARREALVRMARPDLSIAPLRGNVDTRLRKVSEGEVDAAVLAAAGLIRLGRGDAAAEWLDPSWFVPAPGQGAIAVEVRADRLASDLGWLSDADHPATRACVETERTFMRIVEGGCDLPLGAWARHDGNVIVCDGFLVRPGESEGVRDRVTGADPEQVGSELARRLLG